MEKEVIVFQRHWLNESLEFWAEIEQNLPQIDFAHWNSIKPFTGLQITKIKRFINLDVYFCVTPNSYYCTDALNDNFCIINVDWLTGTETQEDYLEQLKM